MQIQDVIELMKHMKQNGISLVEYESEGHRLRLEKTAGMAGQVGVSGQSGGTAADDQSGQTLTDEADRRQQEPAGSPEQLITAPVVGIFYAAPAPESDPFVAVGSEIEAGATVCIIEAMKLMNEVTSHCTGKILEIYVQDGQRVEYGQPLMRIG